MAGRNYVKLLTPAYGAIAFIFAWWLIAFLQLVDPVLLPSPQDSAKAIWVGFFQGNLFSDLRVTGYQDPGSFHNCHLGLCALGFSPRLICAALQIIGVCDRFFSINTCIRFVPTFLGHSWRW